MSYSSAKRAHEERTPEQDERPSYRCGANGCPNAGSIVSGKGRGLCYFHFTGDPLRWGSITAQIKADPSMGNWGHVPVSPSQWVVEARKRVRGPKGMQTINGGQQP